MSEEPINLDINPPDTSMDTAGNVPLVEVESEPPVEEAPVEAPVEEAVAEAPAEATEEAPVEETDTVLDTDVWGDSGSEVGNSVLGMLQDSGVSTEDAKALMYDAIQAGDVSMIDQAALADKVGKNAAAIILSGTKSFIAENAAKNEVAIKEVHTAAGGKDNWDAVATWASGSLPESELAEYRPMIDKGGASARFAVSEIMAAYNNAPANSSIVTNTPRVEATSTSPPARTAMSRAEYVAALDKAHRKGASNKEIATIQAARMIGRKQGL